MPSRNDLPSKEGGYDRTGARTPMQWGGAANAGFVIAPTERCYLPVDPAPDRPTVESQRGIPGSPLETVRRLIRLRLDHPALQAEAAFEPIRAETEGPLSAYRRQTGNEKLLVGINPVGKACTALLPDCEWRHSPETLYGAGDAFARTDGGWMLSLPEVSGGVYRVRDWS
jgi:glycosidase